MTDELQYGDLEIELTSYDDQGFTTFTITTSKEETKRIAVEEIKQQPFFR